MGISGLSMLATYMTNAALQHIPYSVKIVTKSCRIVPVMLFSVVLQGATYSAQEASAAALLVFGVILFVKGDPIGDIPGEQPLHISGFSMLLFAVAVDAVVANLEERFLFRVTPAATRTEAITVLSACASAFSFFALIASGTGSLTLVSQPKLVNRQNIQRGYTGEVWDIHFHAQSSISNPKIWVIVIASAMAGYGAMSFMLVMISMYGVTTTEVVKTLRKVCISALCGPVSMSYRQSSHRLCTNSWNDWLQTLNVIVSFLLFPKPLTWMHFLGALLVLCGLCQFSKRKVKAKATPKAADVEKELQYFTPTKGRRTSRSGISKV